MTRMDRFRYTILHLWALDGALALSQDLGFHLELSQSLPLSVFWTTFGPQKWGVNVGQELWSLGFECLLSTL